MNAIRPWPRLVASGLMAAVLAILSDCAQAQVVAAASAATTTPAAPGNVVVAGDVPDEATRQAVLARMRELYGAERVVDQLGVRAVAVPPRWAEHLQAVLDADLKFVSRGQLDVRGNVIELRGEVASEAQRARLLERLRTRLNNPTYTVRNGLRVSASGQDRLDAALAQRTVEFEPGSATLTATGRALLDELAAMMRAMPERRFEVIGHTDAQGDRWSNLALSAARAETVKHYLATRGIAPTLLGASGAGADRPIASNDTPEGRARNRRIELRVTQ